MTKDKCIQIRLGEEEKLSWEDAARVEKMTLSEWIRWRCNYTYVEAVAEPSPKKEYDYKEPKRKSPDIYNEEAEEKPTYKGAFPGPLTKKMQSSGKMSTAVYKGE